MNRISPPIPTPDQVQANAVITWRDDQGEHTGRACWYPQMGGYVARCVVELSSNGTCFEAWVWHDGDFPFADDDNRDGDGPRPPLRMHHCRADQFIQFGEEVKRFAADAAEASVKSVATTVVRDGRTAQIDVKFYGPIRGDAFGLRHELAIDADAGRKIINFLDDAYGDKVFDLTAESTTFVGCRFISIEDGRRATIEYVNVLDAARKAT